MTDNPGTFGELFRILPALRFLIGADDIQDEQSGCDDDYFHGYSLRFRCYRLQPGTINRSVGQIWPCGG